MAAEAPADLVLRGGEVLTQDPAHTRASAVAARAGVIVAVGSDQEVAPLVGPSTRVIALGGRAVVPSVTDAHAHLVGLGLSLAAVELRGCASPDECARRVAAARANRGAWILGRGWDQNRFATPRFPTRAALDGIAAPVWLRRVDGHAAWANGAALRAAGIGRDTVAPAGGRIERDAHGDPTGIFVDAAMELVERAIPPPTSAEVETAIVRAQDLALAAGLTEVHEMGIDRATVAIYRRLASDGKLKVRVGAYAAQDEPLLATAPDAARAGAMFTLRGMKLYADGALGSRGAALLAPYSDDDPNRGLIITPAAVVERLARKAVAHGWQIAIHAIGDRANREALDAFAKAGVGPAQRFRIEHAQVVAPDDFARFAKLGVIASMQPTHATSDMPWAESRLGAERVRGAYAWRRMLQAGARLAFGSDFPVEEPNVVAGLRAAVERGGWTLDQKLTLDEALRAFTTGAAFAAFEESWRGVARAGMAADFTIFSTPATRLAQSHVDATIVAGRVVYERR